MRTLLFLAFLFILASCSTSNQETVQLSYALQKAGDNRSELEKVIEHNKGDSLKREAACFLIRNMVYHFGYNGRERVEDITSASADYLINNIDLAFQVWPKPWNKTIGFDEFCRYILPYRAIYELPHTLRKEFMETYVPLLDSLRIEITQSTKKQRHEKNILNLIGIGIIVTTISLHVGLNKEKTISDLTLSNIEALASSIEDENGAGGGG